MFRNELEITSVRPQVPGWMLFGLDLMFRCSSSLFVSRPCQVRVVRLSPLDTGVGKSIDRMVLAGVCFETLARSLQTRAFIQSRSEVSSTGRCDGKNLYVIDSKYKLITETPMTSQKKNSACPSPPCKSCPRSYHTLTSFQQPEAIDKHYPDAISDILSLEASLSQAPWVTICREIL